MGRPVNEIVCITKLEILTGRTKRIALFPRIEDDSYTLIGGYRFNKLPDVKSKKFVSRNCEESYIYTPVFLIRNDKEITLSDREKSQVRIFNCDCREMKR